MEEKLLPTYLYNQYKRLGTQKVFCATQPVHVTHTEYTLKHTTIRSALYNCTFRTHYVFNEVLGLCLQKRLWHWIVIYVERNNHSNKQSHYYGIFRPIRVIFRVLYTSKEGSGCLLYLQHVTWRYGLYSGLCCLFSGCFPRFVFFL